MRPQDYANSMEAAADGLAEALWEGATDPDFDIKRGLNTNTRKAIRRTMATLQMILDGDIRSPQDMAAEAEGRASE